MAVTDQKRLISTSDVSARYGGKDRRTIKRWAADGTIPPPDTIIHNRPYWDEAALDRRDRERVAEIAERKGRSRPP